MRADRKDDELPTELALATDGRLYVNSKGVAESKLRGQSLFEGRAVRCSSETVAEIVIGAAIAGLRLAIGSDGVVYLETRGKPKSQGEKERPSFRGFAMTKEEQRIAAIELHGLAFNITIAVQQVLCARRKRQKTRKMRQHMAISQSHV